MPNAKGAITLACWTMIPLAIIFPTKSNTGRREKQFSPSWHVLPVHWGGQIHLNPSTRSWQVPPWPQGFGEQSSISVRQNKERLSSVTKQAMSVTDKFGFPWGIERQQDFCLEFLALLWFQQKPPFKHNSSSKHRGGSLHLWPFCK